MGSAQASCCSSAEDKYDDTGSDCIGTLSDEKLAIRTQEPLASKEIDLVQKTWHQVNKLGAETVGVALFKNIFKLAPEAIKLFPFKADPNVLSYETPGLKAHAVRVVGTVGVAVEGLRNLPGLTPTLEELGLRHHGYGVRQPHYGVVGKALLMTLKAVLDRDFTLNVQLAWAKVWEIISSAMLGGSPDGHPQMMTLKSSLGKIPASEVALVKQSWATAAATGAEAVGVALFRHIFRVAPEAVMLFPFRDEADIYESSSLKSHAAQVVSTVDVAVSGLDNLGLLTPTLQSLGLRHVGYGVKPAHYDVVGQALLATLRDGLGKAFTPELEAAWLKVWVIISEAMIGTNYDATES